MSKSSEEVIFEKIREGDIATFKTYFNTHFSSINQYCLGIVRDPLIAEEITQDAFIYLWENRLKINIHSSLRSYLFRTVKNKAINYLKNELPKQQAQEELFDTFVIKTEDRSSQEFQKKIIQRAIDQLPEKCKEIFILSRFAGLTYREIADELDISTKTVENQMNIAFKKLKETLSKIDGLRG